MMKHLLCLVVLYNLYFAAIAQYPKIGDLITNSDGSKGVVFWISPDGSRGWMIALHDSPPGFWGKVNVDVPGLKNIANTSDLIKELQDTAGYQNTSILRQFQGPDNKYVAQKIDFEHGWYLPTPAQFYKLRLIWSEIKSIVIHNGGEDLLKEYYWTSSECSPGEAWVIKGELNFSQDIYVINTMYKESGIPPCYTRPIRSFTNTNLSYRWNTNETTPAITVSPKHAEDYTVTMTSVEGWVATATQHITVNPTYITPTQASLPKGGHYDFGGKKLTVPGIYDDTLTSVSGCDSIIRLTLTVGDSYLLESNAAICQGELFDFRGRILRQEGVYDDSLKSAIGSDSIYRLHLTVYKTYLFEDRKAICQGELFDFRGRILRQEGVYNDSLKTINGCDSIYRLHLTVHPTFFEDMGEATICSGDKHPFRGRELTKPGIYCDSLKTMAGCDSVYQLKLNVNPSYLFEDSQSRCQGEMYNFRGKTYDMTGIYDDSLKTVTGCDSIYRLNLTVNPTYDFKNEVTICQGEIYNFHGRMLTEPGVYYDSLRTVTGCDSIYKLTLAVNPTYLSPESRTICQGEIYRFRGREFNSTGTYDDTLKTVARCDSIFRLHLTVNPTHCIESNESICQGETYTFRGNTYNTTGTYDDSLKTTVTGCDSIFRLHLTVNPTYSFEESETICQGEKYNFHGQELTEPGEYYDSLRTVTGCDSIYKLTLNVNPTYLSSESGTICQGEVYRFRGREFNSTGTYDDTLKTVAGCDSIFRLHLTVNPTYHPVIDTLICRGERYAENGFNETESGEYIQRLTSVHGCDSVVTLRLRVADYFDGDIEMALEDCRTHEYSFAAKNRGVADDYDYLWDFGDGNTAEEAEIVHHYADSGIYSVRLTVTAANRCAKEMSMPVQVPYFSEDFEIVAEPAEIDEAHPEIGFSTACVPGLTYLWEFGDGASGTGCKTAHQYALQEKSWYQVRLTVSNQEDCSTEEEMQIMSWSKVKSINTFSPNGDNVNDVFREGFHIKVFNRNGVLIFEGENGWDGSYKGKQVTEGVYFYEADNFSSQGARKDNGYITVIR